MNPAFKIGLVFTALFLCFSRFGHAEPDFERLADAIRIAEGNPNYGVLTKYKTTTARQACINTAKHKYRDWVALGSRGDFLEYLASKYAPRHAANDPTDLNKNWLPNVRNLYED